MDSKGRLRMLIDLFEGAGCRGIMVGDRVRLDYTVYDDSDLYENEDRPFYSGHEFIVESVGGRTYHLIDDNGNRLEVWDKHIEFVSEREGSDGGEV